MLDTARLALFHATSWIARLILLVLVTVAPWWYGGAQWQSQTYLVTAGLCLAASTWLSTLLSPRRTAGCVRLSYVMVGFMALAAIQVLPQPPILARAFSSSAVYVQQVRAAAERSSLPSVASSQQLRQPIPEASTWSDVQLHNTASVHPLQTRASLAVFAVAVVALWSSATLLISSRWTMALAIVLASGGVVNGFLGLLQLVSFDDWTLLAMPNADTYFATFVSRNSAPGYYAVCIAATFIVLGTAFRSQKRKRRQEYRVTYPGTSWAGRLRNRLEDVFIDLNSTAVTCMCVIVFMFVAVLATFSRGGVIAASGAALVTICLTLGGRGGLTKATTAAGVTLVGIFALMSFLEIGDVLWERLDELNNVIQTGEDARLVIWKYVASAVPSYWLTGCGFGSFRFAILPFHDGNPAVWYHHAESLPLEVLLEMGLPGAALLCLALGIVIRQLYVQSGLQKEELTLAAALFATCAIVIQSAVDFNLILPGVFLPYCVLLGTFLGRCRRIDQDQARIDELGEDALDARKLARLGVRTPTKGKLIGHSLVAASSMACMLLGQGPLAGYASAGRLSSLLRASEPVDQDFETGFQTLAASAQTLIDQTHAALEAHPTHPEVGLIVAQIEQLLWRLNATTSINWGSEHSLKSKWDFSNPTTLAMILRSSDPELKPLRDAIESDEYGMKLASASFARFQRALAACPLDYRAAWGIFSSNLNWLTADETNLLLENLWRLTGNNASVNLEIGILALRDGWRERGLTMIGRAVALDPNRLTRNTLKAVATDITREQLEKLFAYEGSVVAMAGAARTLNELAVSTSAPVPEAAQLSRHLTDLVYSKLSQPIDGSIGLDGYESLAWIAKEKRDTTLELRYLEQLSRLAPEDYGRRLRYAQHLFDLGEKDKAISELQRFLTSESPNSEVRVKCQEQIEKWLLPVDPNA